MIPIQLLKSTVLTVALVHRKRYRTVLQYVLTLLIGDARAGKVHYAQVPRPIQQPARLPGDMSPVRHTGSERIGRCQQHLAVPDGASPEHELHRDGTQVRRRPFMFPSVI